jgi:hypothetical protein
MRATTFASTHSTRGVAPLQIHHAAAGILFPGKPRCGDLCDCDMMRGEKDFSLRVAGVTREDDKTACAAGEISIVRDIGWRHELFANEAGQSIVGGTNFQPVALFPEHGDFCTDGQCRQ